MNLELMSVGELRVTVRHLLEKWDFEHGLAMDQEVEIKRLDAEVADLRARIADDGTRGAPSYVPPHADPKLMNWADGKEHSVPQNQEDGDG